MSYLSFIDRRTIDRLFGIKNGYIFDFWVKDGRYNKNITHDMILESCGIDIYNDSEYNSLSQAKCINKIFSEQSPVVISHLLRTLLDFFASEMGTSYWGDEDNYDYSQIEKIIERLNKTGTIEIPEAVAGDMQLLQQDIERNIVANTPELVLDRLHTFATQYFRDICTKHDIPISDERGNNYALDGLVGKLKKFYESRNYFASEFCLVAIRNSIDLFAKFNDIRNSSSFSHPNPILEKHEAEYVVKIIANTLMFIDKIENQQHIDNVPSFEDEDELPF